MNDRLDSIFSPEKLRKKWSTPQPEQPTEPDEMVRIAPESVQDMMVLFQEIKETAVLRFPEERHAILNVLLEDLEKDLRSNFIEKEHIPEDRQDEKVAMIRKIEQIEELIDAFEMVS